ncbi:MAG: PBSX family phage terminase large subunit [Elusimicrobiales bacterium]
MRIEVRTTRIFSANLAARAAAVVNVGGARSSKSHSLAQLLIMRAANEQGARIAVTRKTMPALERTAYRLVIDLLKAYGLYDSAFHGRSKKLYQLGDSVFEFFSLDDPEKIKSSEYNYIWMEEANEFSWEDYLALSTRLSAKPAPGEKNRIYISINPSDTGGWIPKRLMRQPDVEVIHSTWRDNPFLPPEYAATINGLKEQDENAWRVYCLGQWGMRRGLVYPDWQPADSPPENPDDTVFGLDFGFNNPTALVRADLKDGALFLDELLYESGLTNSALCERLRAVIPPELSGRPVYADSAEPARIEELVLRGWDARATDKAVLEGIETLRGFRLRVTRRSANLIKEIENYCWRTTPSGAALDEPVRFNDHALDAARYAARTHLRAKPGPDISFI